MHTRLRQYSVLVSVVAVVSSAVTATGVPVAAAPRDLPARTEVAAPRAAAPLVDPPPGPATYAYDSLGRVAGVVGADGSVARYTYDPAGNPLSVERLGTPAVAVLSTVPGIVRPGDAMVVSGKGFGTTATANTVKVNGVTATVKTAAADRLTVTVPTSATTGAVTVTTSAGTGTGPVVTVVRNDKPTVTDVTPKIAAAGSTVTVTTTNSDPEFANNLVRVNGMLAAVTARSGGSLTVRIPPGAATGTVSLSTPAGTGTSSAVLVVPPTGIDPASIDTAAAITAGTATQVPVAARKWAVRYFSAADGDRFAFSLSDGTFGSCGLYARVHDERNRQTATGSCVGTGGWIDTGPTSGPGLRTIFLRNDTDTAGTTTVTVRKVPADLNAGAQSLSGTAKAVTVANPGQNAYTTFSGTAGGRVIIQTTNASSQFGCCGLYWWLVAPDGTRVGDTKYPNDTLDTTTLPQTGTYRVFLDPGGANTGSVTVSAWSVPADLNAGTQPLDGTAKTVTFTKPGQNAYTTFAGTAGNRVTVQSTNASSQFGCCGLYWWLVAPDGTRVGDTKYANDTLDTITLPQTGTYRIVADPSSVLIGSVTFTAWTVPADLNAGTLTLDGTAKTVTISSAGQDAYVTFSATTGQRVLFQSLDTSANLGCCGATWQVIAPDGTRLSDEYMNSTVDTRTLPQTGTYKIWFGPRGTNTGSTTFKAWTVPADLNAGTLTLDGTGKTVSITNPGQDGYVTFSATAGQRVIFQSLDTSANLGCCGAAWQVFAPDGTRISDEYMNSTVDTKTLTQTGTYKISFGPYAANTGSTTFKAWTVPADLNAGTLTLDGTGKTVSITSPGQDGYVTFSGTAGQRVIFQSLDTSANLGCCGAAWQVFAPDGTRMSDEYMNSTVDTKTLPQTGTYKISFGPYGTNTGSTTFKAWTVPADVNAGTITLDGTGKTISITNPGQDGYVTFSGTTGQRVIFQSTDTSANLGCCGAAWQVFAPDGTRMSDEYMNSTVDTKTLSQTGTYKISFGPYGTNTGSTTFKAWTVPADLDAGTITLDGTAKTVTVTNPGQDAFVTFSGTAGQAVTIGSSNTSGSLGCCGAAWQIIAPDGQRLTDQYMNTEVTGRTLPQTGTYKVWFGPYGINTGATTFTARTATALAAAVAPPAEQAKQNERTEQAPAVTAVAEPKHETRTKPQLLPTRLRDDSLRVDPDPASPNAATLVRDDRLDAAWTPDAGNLDGRDWLTRRGPATPVTDLTAPKGVTAISGHVLGLDGRPLAGIPVRVDSIRTTTDASGRFLLSGVRANATMIVVDGYAAATGKSRYGTFRIHARVERGRTTPLDAPVWLPKLDMAHTVKLAAPTANDTVLTTPAIPGLEVHIPVGTVVRDMDGKVVTELGITAIPIDRPPYPLPRNGIVPTFFTVQPGGATIFPDGASVVYPNYTKLPAGTVVDFWNYDPAEKQWYVYGHGKVNADASRVIPDEKTKLWTLDGAMFNTGGNPKPDKPWWQDLLDKLSGDPVDLSTGLLTDTHTDLGLDDTVPIALNRQYWQGDNHSRDFGLNSGADHNMYLASEQQYQEVDLYTPGGGRAHYVRTSPGTGYGDAVFAAVGSPGRYTGSTIAQENGDWVLTLRDGTKWFFPWYSRPRAMRDRNGNEVTFVRPSGANGEVTQIVSPNGRWIGLEYDASARVIRASDNIGRQVGYTYDTAGRLATVTDPAGKVTTYTYDTANRVTGITDGRGNTYLSVAYDANGRVSRQDIADGGSFTFAYTLDAQNQVTETRVTQPNGSVRRVTFTATGMVATDTTAFGTSLARTTTYERGAGNRLDAVVDPYGRRAEYTYDAADRVVKATGLADTAGEYTSAEATWGPYDQPTTTKDAAGRTSTFTYDAKGNLLTATDPLGRTTTTTRTSAGQVATLRDPAGATTTFTWESGTLTGVRDALGRTATTFHDAAGRPVLWTDAAGARKLVAYDALNNPVKVTDALGGVSTFTYDANGNRTAYTDPRGKTTSWTYDKADRAVTRVDPFNRTDTTTYDGTGRVTATVSRAGLRTEMTYDQLNRPVSIRYGVTGAGTQQSKITYGYDALDRLTTLTDTAGGTTSQTWDSFDRLATTTGPNGTVGYTYDVLGRTTGVTVPGLPATTYTYDNADQLTGATRGGDTVTVTRDAAGRASAVALPGGWRQAFTRDAIGQVTGIAYSHNGTAKGDLGYTYDAVSRRTSVTGSLANVALPAARSDLAYDNGNRLVSAGGTALTYDNDGNLLSDGTTTYTWNARGELTGTSRSGLTSTNVYGPTGVRDTRTVGSATTRFVYDGANAAAELDAAGTLSAGLLAMGTDKWAGRAKAGITDSVLTDGLGSPLALGRADGTLAATQSYDPFGVPATTGDARGSDLSFTGRQDDGTGLLQYRERYYSPALGRFISEDPIGYQGGGNLYAYVGNSPANATDPNGTNPLLLGCLGGAAMDAAMDYAGQRLSGRKVDWGWGGVGGAAAAGCLGGMLGAGIGKWLSKAADMRDIQNGWKAANGKGWQRGQDIYSKTAAGNDPAWSTVRSRYWKNAAEHPSASRQWSDADLARMRSGQPPTRYNPDKGGMESMELSHEPIPMRDGGKRVVPRWPQDHAARDPFRHPGY
ncbi:RHS repeat-associated core domain-containing protein [Lentzea chajnantorensis]